MLEKEFLELQNQLFEEELEKRGHIFLSEVMDILEKATLEWVTRDFMVHPEKWIDYSEWIAGGCKGRMYKNGEKPAYGWVSCSEADLEYIDFGIFNACDNCELDLGFWESIEKL